MSVKDNIYRPVIAITKLVL